VRILLVVFKVVLFSALAERFAKYLCVFNSKSVDENLKKAKGCVVVTLMFFIIMNLWLYVKIKVWYIALGYSVMSVVFIGLMMTLISEYAKTKFNSYLPDLFKKTYDRIGDYYDIVELLEEVKANLKSPLRRQIDRVIDALSLNSRNEIDWEIERITRIFMNHNFDIFLSLIVQAKYVGINKDVIKQYGMQAKIISTKNIFMKRLKANGYMTILLNTAFLLSGIYIVGVVNNDFYLDMTGERIDYSSIVMQLTVLGYLFIYLISVIHITVMRRLD